MSLDALLAEYQRFFQDNKILLKGLAEGQKPEVMVISCSDSRMPPVFKPGAVFSARNVAALVPPYQSNYEDPDGIRAALEHGVRNLRVKHLVVKGHGDCGGIKAVLNPPPYTQSFIKSWVQIAEPAKKRTLEMSKDACEHQELCEKESIKTSLQNLMTFECVKKRVEVDKDLTLHGWYYNIHKQQLEIFNQQTNTFEPYKSTTSVEALPKPKGKVMFPVVLPSIPSMYRVPVALGVGVGLGVAATTMFIKHTRSPDKNPSSFLQAAVAIPAVEIGLEYFLK